MKFLFSGAKHSLSPQTDKTQSLGGYMSNTPIPNGRTGAMFSSISSYAKKNKKEEVLAFFIYNDTALAITNLSIQQVYAKLLGIQDNEAEFEWAIVEPTDDHRIELIGSPSEIPFEAEFFDPTSVRESCLLKITAAALSGETFTLLGENIVFIGNTVEDMVDEIVAHFSSVKEFIVEKYSSQHILITRSELIETGLVVQIATSGAALSNVVNFEGFVDGETIIAPSLLAGKSLGVWVKRKVNAEIYQDHNETEIEIESLEVVFNYD